MNKELTELIKKQKKTSEENLVLKQAARILNNRNGEARLRLGKGVIVELTAKFYQT